MEMICKDHLAATSPTSQTEEDCVLKEERCLISCSKYTKIDPNDLIFRLFTNSSNSSQVIRYKDDSSLHASFFNRFQPTRFIIHGLCGDGESNINKLIRSAYVEHGQYNIIVVDWGVYSSVWKLGCAKQRVKDIGTHVGQFIAWLKKADRASLETTSVIGYSLGSHVAGHAGKYLNSNGNEKLHTIVALDPAGVCFSFNQSEIRVESTDAEYVEVIHTSKNWGIQEPIGTADFYPNVGSFHPGCSAVPLCSHRYAFRYFAQSVRNASQYMSIKCSDYTEMWSGKCSSNGTMIKMGGEPSNHGLAEGIYYNSNGSKIIDQMFWTFNVISFVFVKTLIV